MSFDYKEYYRGLCDDDLIPLDEFLSKLERAKRDLLNVHGDLKNKRFLVELGEVELGLILRGDK